MCLKYLHIHIWTHARLLTVCTINIGFYSSFLAVLITLPANSTLEQLSGRHYLIFRLTTPTGSIIDANTPPIKMVDIYKAYLNTAGLINWLIAVINNNALFTAESVYLNRVVGMRTHRCTKRRGHLSGHVSGGDESNVLVLLPQTSNKCA